MGVEYMSTSIKFWTPKGKLGFLSNFYSSEFKIGGVFYPTNEHFFQSQKFAGTEYEEYIIRLQTPAETAKEGKRRDLPLRKDWEDVKEGIMLKGLRAKFNQSLELKNRLLETREAYLIEDSPYDYYWGVGRNKTGKNRLGVLLMQVREELKLLK
jgi:ribA/ribD-fused uncharacterized protein